MSMSISIDDSDIAAEIARGNVRIGGLFYWLFSELGDEHDFGDLIACQLRSFLDTGVRLSPPERAFFQDVIDAAEKLKSEGDDK